MVGAKSEGKSVGRWARETEGTDPRGPRGPVYDFVFYSGKGSRQRVLS